MRDAVARLYTDIEMNALWDASGLIENQTWAPHTREALSDDYLAIARPFLSSTMRAVQVSQTDYLVLPDDAAPAELSRLAETMRSCIAYADEMGIIRTRLRIAIVLDAPKSQFSAVFPNNVAIACIERSDAIVSGHLPHEFTHCFGLSGFSVLDEGIAVFLERALSVAAQISALEKAQGWLSRTVRIGASSKDPYTLGSAGLCAAFIQGGKDGLRSFLQAARDCEDANICVSFFQEKISEVGATLRSKDHGGPSNDLEYDYFAGHHEAFKDAVNKLATKDKTSLNLKDWRNLGRFLGLVAVDQFPSEADRQMQAWALEARDGAPEETDWYFELADILGRMQSAEGRDSFAKSAEEAMAFLAQASDDPSIGADATITLMYLYRYLPDFAGGSLDRARELAEVMTTQFGRPETADQLNRTIAEQAIAQC
ncbi:hypothetical protein [Phaeobacter sp.]|uniref:hypothetical protein n=1 Tax=Phaeobacter sp. TaxID=1902409 RepID=UPI0025DB1CDD|nr:hypothetical protein [Phaeobacter sp.]